jgi:STE24 endopeptidase
MDTVMKLLMNILSRHHEFEADAFAVSLGFKTQLAKSLIKLQVQNLSTMDADWLYASYHYSHPILPERLAALGWKSGEKVSDSNGKVLGEVDDEEPGRVLRDGKVLKASGRDEL